MPVIARALCASLLLSSQAFAQIETADPPSGCIPTFEAQTRPVLAVASVTFERVRQPERPVWLKEMMDALYRSPGMLGAHTATSFEDPGLILIFSWWQNLEMLNDFYGGDLHRRWFGERGSIVGSTQTTYFASAPSEVGLELFAPLPGGFKRGRWFTPEGVAK